MIFIRHRTAENNQRHLSYGFKNILFGDNNFMHYVDLFPIGVFGKSGTTKIWGGAFAPPAPPLATPLHMTLTYNYTPRNDTNTPPHDETNIQLHIMTLTDNYTQPHDNNRDLL